MFRCFDQNFIHPFLPKTCFVFQNILDQLRTIFDLIINFQKIQDEMYIAAEDELGQRQAYISTQEVKTKQVIILPMSFNARSAHKELIAAHSQERLHVV